MDKESEELKCGVCGTHNSNITHYIYHKIICIQKSDINGDELTAYQCKLCSHHFSRRASLLNHYMSYHKLVRGSTETSPLTAKESPGRENGLASKTSIHKTKESAISGSSIEVAEPEKEVEVNAQMLSDDFYFTTVNETIKGSSLVYMKTYLSCVYCMFRSSVMLELIRHMQSKHEEIISVHIDNQEVPDNSRDVIRMSEYIARTEQMVRLTESTKSSPSSGGQRRHQSLLNKNRCKFCQKYFSNKNYLKRHIEKQHEKPRIYKCDLCDHTEKARYKLKAHREKHLSKEFRCTECDFVSSSKPAIRMHRQIHSNGSFMCEVCGKAFNVKDSLQKHRKVHDKSRPYACTFSGCTLRFQTERMCKGHLKTHYTETNTFVCDQCGYSFRHKHHLKRHLEGTHKVPYIRTRTQGETIETCEIPVSSTDGGDRNKHTLTTLPGEASKFNLKSIILNSREGFNNQSQDEGMDHEQNTESTMLLLGGNTDTTTSLSQADDVCDNQNTVYFESASNEQCLDPSGPIQILHNRHSYTDNTFDTTRDQTSVLLEQTDQDIIDTEGIDHQVSVVEYIVHADSNCVTFTATAAEESEALFN